MEFEIVPRPDWRQYEYYSERAAENVVSPSTGQCKSQLNVILKRQGKKVTKWSI